MFEIFSYGFMQRAFITGIFIASACSLLGVFLVLRKNAFIGEGLAHISFGGVAFGLLLGLNPIISALLLTLIGAIGITKLQQKSKIYSDTAIAIISYTGFALGIFLVSISKGFNAGLFSFLFGNILSISRFDMILSIILLAGVISFLLLFLQEIKFITFDEDTAKVAGIKVDFLNYLISLLVGVTVVLSMRIVGIILVASFMIIPAATSLQIAKNFKQTLCYSVVISILCVIGGLILSYLFDIPSGATIVMLNFVIFMASYLLWKN